MLLKQGDFQKQQPAPKPISHCQWPQLRFQPGLPHPSLPQPGLPAGPRGQNKGVCGPQPCWGRAGGGLGAQAAASTPRAVANVSPASSHARGWEGREVKEATLSCSYHPLISTSGEIGGLV